MAETRSGKRRGTRNRPALILGLILLGGVLRFAFLGTYPVGLNQDEASIGYEAWSLLNYGVDRNGQAWPVLFISWGSGQNVLYAYLSIPFIALFGLNAFSVRLVAAILGTLTLPLVYLLAARLRPGRAALWILAVVALNPWHITMTRWALESNILPFFLLLGIYLALVSLKCPWALVGCGAAFALALYAYGTAFLFVPLFFLLAIRFMWRHGRFRPRHVLAALTVFCVIALPIALCQLRNALGLGEMRLFGLTLPALVEGRQAATVSLTPSVIWENLGRFARVLYAQTDGLVYNGIPGWLLLPGGMLLAVAGVVKSVLDRGKNGEWLMLIALLAGCLCACVIQVNINRINMVFLPILYFSGVGLWWGVSALSRLAVPRGTGTVLAGVWMAAALGIFVYLYLGSYQEQMSLSFHEGLGEAIVYADEQDFSGVQITNDVNAPYIYVLFHLQVPPQTYLDTVSYRALHNGFQFVGSFDRYRFSDRDPEPGWAYITTPERAEGLEILAHFGNYVVAVG